MDGIDSIMGGRRRSLKERLGLKSMTCCGATWGFRPNTVNLSDSDDDDDEEPQQPQQNQNGDESANPDQIRPDNQPVSVCVGRIPPISGGMNLAAALEAERHLPAADVNNVMGPTVTNDVAGLPSETQLKGSLMKLLAETDGCDGEKKAGEGGIDSVCCVCMERKKGSAFIPCGHTFCRMCSREMWLNRGSCPLCNRWILEILDIF